MVAVVVILMTTLVVLGAVVVLVVLMILVVVIVHGRGADASPACQGSYIWNCWAVIPVVLFNRILPRHVVVTGVTLGSDIVLVARLWPEGKTIVPAQGHLQQRGAVGNHHRRPAFL